VTLRELATKLGCPVDGVGDPEIRRVAGIEQAGPGDVTFLANPRYTAAAGATRAAAIIARPDLPVGRCPIIRSVQPYLTFARAAALLAPDVRPAPGVDAAARVAADAAIGEGASIGAYAVVGSGARIGPRTVVHPHVVIGSGAVVGPDCLIHAHVSIREGCTLGARVVVQNGAVIGSDGFGFATRPDGGHEKIPQIGPVVIEDDVEIGANTTIDRPAVGETRIRAGTKIDNLVQIGHGVVLGRNVLLAAQVGIAGSTVVGDAVILGGQVGVGGHLTIGDRARAVGQSGITHSLDTDAFVSGYPAIDNLEWRKASAVFRRLPAMRKELLALVQGGKGARGAAGAKGAKGGTGARARGVRGGKAARGGKG
jgi:UDP-3-O-[3-hydroxymyristoyl] glucosamine N-acyltransferase